MNHFNKLTPAEDERLALLIEEAGEVIKAVGKIMRHGYESHHPRRPSSVTNRLDLAEEIGHFMHAVDRLIGAGDIKENNIENFERLKSASVTEYLHHQTADVINPAGGE